MLKQFVFSVVAIVALAIGSQSHAATCQVTSVRLEGVAADSCVGMISGNFNSLSDINAVSPYAFDSIDTGLITNTTRQFSFDKDTYGDLIGIALKQNTQWAVYFFDLTKLTITGLVDGVWNTRLASWDGNRSVAGCQGCGGLSHAALVYTKPTEVPVPGTLGLLGLGIAGLGMIRRRNLALD